LLDQRRGREDFFILSNLRIFQNIDDLELVKSGELFLADALEIGDRGGSPRAGARDV
jgi:hypothetical protein